MMPNTQAKALEHLAAILAGTLDILSHHINYHDSIPFGCLSQCNHGHSGRHLVYHRWLAGYLGRLQSTMQATLDSVNEKIQALPYDIWTDPIEGPILRYQMTCHEGIEFEHYGSEHHVSTESALTDPPEERTLEMIEDTKGERDTVRFIASTRMAHAMWMGETEAEFEEVMNDHSWAVAREEERRLENRELGIVEPEGQGWAPGLRRYLEGYIEDEQ